MSFSSAYLDRVNLGIYPDLTDPQKDLSYSVVIPCFNEPNLSASLNSLWNCKRPDGSIELIVVINSGIRTEEKALIQNNATEKELTGWMIKHQEKGFRVIPLHLREADPKFFGAGLARKTGMDLAFIRFMQIDKPEGIILSYDADSVSDNNYFTAIDSHLLRHPETKAFNLYFEHPLEGKDFPGRVYNAITSYELHLRYYIQGLRLSGFPFAYHTVGSCFGVRADTYASQGGMNRKKAGEDFYFLQKVIPLGDFHEINATRVIPSPRPSLRVPFGTGATIHKALENELEEQYTYHPAVFDDLKKFIERADDFFGINSSGLERLMQELPSSVKGFIGPELEIRLGEINDNTTVLKTFRKRFYAWFNSFKVMKFIHYAHDHYYHKIPVTEAADLLARNHIAEWKEGQSAVTSLKILRKLQREAWYGEGINLHE